MLDNLKVDVRYQDYTGTNGEIHTRWQSTTVSFDQVAGTDKSTYQKTLTEATTHKIRDFANRNAKWFDNNYHLAGVGLLALGCVVFIVPTCLLWMNVASAQAACNAYLSMSNGLALFGKQVQFILGTTLSGLVSLGVFSVVASCFEEGQKNPSHSKSLFSSMKHDQIVAFFKEVGITSKDLLDLGLIKAKPNKKLTLEDVKLVFELDTGDKEITKQLILDLAKQDKEMAFLLLSLMREEKYKELRDYQNALFDQKFEDAFHEILISHVPAPTDPVASAPAVEPQPSLYPKVPPLSPALAATA